MVNNLGCEATLTTNKSIIHTGALPTRPRGSEATSRVSNHLGMAHPWHRTGSLAGSMNGHDIGRMHRTLLAHATQLTRREIEAHETAHGNQPLQRRLKRPSTLRIDRARGGIAEPPHLSTARAASRRGGPTDVPEATRAPPMCFRARGGDARYEAGGGRRRRPEDGGGAVHHDASPSRLESRSPQEVAQPHHDASPNRLGARTHG